MRAQGVVLGDSEFHVTDRLERPPYQGPVERVPRITRRNPHVLVRQGFYPPNTPMGVFIIDDILIFVAKIIIFVKKLIDFIKALIEGALVSALLGIISFALPMFSGVVNLGNLGIGWINDVVQSLTSGISEIGGTLVEGVADVLGLPGISPDMLTQLDVFDSLSSYTGLDMTEVMPDLNPVDAVLSPIPTTPEQWVEGAVSAEVESAVDNELEKTPLGKAVKSAKDLEKLAEEGLPPDPLSATADSVPVDEMSDKAMAKAQSELSAAKQALADKAAAAQALKDQAAARAAAAQAQGEGLLSQAESGIEKEYTSLEERLAAQADKYKSLLKVPKLSLDDVLGFFMQFLQPGQTLQDLSPDEFAMIAAKLRAEYPGFEIPPFDLSALLFRSNMKRWIGPMAMMAMLGVGAWYMQRSFK